MSIAVDTPRTAPRLAALASPLVLLAGAVALCCLVLLLPVNVPVGPMYWDLFVYFDGANRIFDGQVPVLDFFTPAGPLGYYLFAAVQALFPVGQPALAAHWSLLLVSAPLMALVVGHVDRRSRTVAFALLIPFLVFALLPFNTRDYYPYPGSDGFGIYNRQVCQVLYILVAALMFVKSPRLLAALVALTMTALFFLKITGFVSGAILCLFAFATGRLAFRHAAAAAIAFLAVLAGLEVATGLISHYLGDIRALVAMNSDSLLPRFLQAASHTFGVIVPGGVLILLLLYVERARIGANLAALRAAPGFGKAAAILDSNALWLGVALFAGLFFETQNTGSQAMILVWPVLLAILMRSGALMATPKLLIAALALVGAASLPVIVNTTERAARAYAGAVKNFALEHENLKTLGRVNMRPDVLERSARMIDFYPRHADTYEDFVAVGELPSFIQYSDFDFQIVHLMAIDRAVSAIRALEAEKDLHFETMMTLNFVNVFPWLMDRSAPKHIAIGADPTRAVPPPGADVKAAVRNVDLALYPRCPPTTANAGLWDIYAPMLADHARIQLTPCYDAYVHPRFAEKVR